MAKENLIRVRVDDAAKKAIEDTANELDMKESGVASRVYKWFAAQDDLTKKHVLSLLPQGYEAELLERALERYRAKKAGKK